MHDDDDIDDDALLAAAWERMEAECLRAGIRVIDQSVTHAVRETDHGDQ